MRSVSLALLLLCACDSPPRREIGAAPPDPARLAELVTPAPIEVDIAALRDRALPALRAALPGGGEPRLRAIRPGRLEAVCGEVAADGADKAAADFRRFIVFAGGDTLIAESAQIAVEDPFDRFAVGWIDYCASIDELKRLVPAVDAALPPPPPLEPAAPVLADQEDPDEFAPPDLPVEPDRAGPEPTIDSFEKAVRKD